MYSRRKILVSAVGALAVFAAVLAAFPFLSSMQPSAKAKTLGFLQVDLTNVPEGSFLIKPTPFGRDLIFYKPSRETIAYLMELNDKVEGPKIMGPLDAPAFVYFSGSTHIRGGAGCIVQPTPQGKFHKNWYAGWWDPCHCGAWDYAGRTILGQNACRDKPLENLLKPSRIEWEGQVATVYRM